jgi:hypothetical protein
MVRYCAPRIGPNWRAERRFLPLQARAWAALGVFRSTEAEQAMRMNARWSPRKEPEGSDLGKALNVFTPADVANPFLEQESTANAAKEKEYQETIKKLEAKIAELRKLRDRDCSTC